jgi:hypothetical protein
MSIFRTLTLRSLTEADRSAVGHPRKKSIMIVWGETMSERPSIFAAAAPIAIVDRSRMETQETLQLAYVVGGAAAKRQVGSSHEYALCEIANPCAPMDARTIHQFASDIRIGIPH